MSGRDDAYIYDMLLEARRIARFIDGVDRAAFDGDEVLQYALVRAITVFGEAARRVSEARRERHPEIPWDRIIGMRNRLVHEYDHVDLDVVWDVAKNRMPPLLEALERIAPRPEAGDDGAEGDT